MRRSHLAILAFLAALQLWPAESSCRSLDSIFTEANNAFWNGDYEKAAAKYEELEALGVHSPELSYNLATAHARQKRLGKAVQHYERALRLAPGHRDATHNLAKTREFIARKASRRAGTRTWPRLCPRGVPCSTDSLRWGIRSKMLLQDSRLMLLIQIEMFRLMKKLLSK